MPKFVWLQVSRISFRICRGSSSSPSGERNARSWETTSRRGVQKTKSQLRNARKAEAKKRKFEADAKKGGGFQGATPPLAIKDVRSPKQQKGAKGTGKDTGAGKGKGGFPEGINRHTCEGKKICFAHSKGRDAFKNFAFC